MIYVDTSVVFAALFAEERRSPAEFWAERLISSRLLEFETWARLSARRPTEDVIEAARRLVGSADLVEMSPIVVSRALEPFPVPVRTLDAFHLATATYLQAQGMRLRYATYDVRQSEVARALKLDVFQP